MRLTKPWKYRLSLWLTLRRKVTEWPITLSRSRVPSSLISSASIWKSWLISSLIVTEETDRTSGPRGVVMPSKRGSWLIGIELYFPDFNSGQFERQRKIAPFGCSDIGLSIKGKAEVAVLCRYMDPFDFIPASQAGEE